MEVSPDNGHKICPLCSGQFKIITGAYGDGQEMSTAICQQCQFEILEVNLSNLEIVESTCHYHLRKMLELIILGVKAQEIINSLPFFPHNRSRQILDIATAKSELFKANGFSEELKPFDPEDLKLLKTILNLK